MQTTSNYVLILIILMAGCIQRSNSKSQLNSEIDPNRNVAFARGGVDGGGGNYLGTSPEKIKITFNLNDGKALKESVKYAIKMIEIQVQNRMVNEKLQSIFSIMLGEHYGSSHPSIVNDIENSRYFLSEIQHCQITSFNSETDYKSASTQMNIMGSDICFSSEFLQRLPLEAIPFQLVAIAIHEHAHHYGIGEEDATLAQNHIADILTRRSFNQVLFHSIQTTSAIVDQSQELLRTIDSRKFNKTIFCMGIVDLNHQINILIEIADQLQNDFQIHWLMAASSFGFYFDHKKFNSWALMNLEVNEIQKQCYQEASLPLDPIKEKISGILAQSD